MGGAGKTRLALRVAAEVQRAFRDGVWFVDLGRLWQPPELAPGAHDPEKLSDLVRAVLGARRGGGSPTGQLTDYLADRQVLLVLDNCEHLLLSCAIVVDTVLRACPALRVVATSREPLATVGEMLYPVPPLPTPAPGDRLSPADLAGCEAVALFEARAQAAAPDWVLTDGNADATAELCRRLDGLPLAIELAAARVKTVEPGQMLDRLTDRFALLSRGGRTAPARQQTLRACVEWSFDLCGGPERLLWARSSVFAGGFDLEAVEGICADGSLPAADWLRLVAGLVDKSILVRDDVGESRPEVARYRMLETVREFGHERLREAGEYEVLHHRHRLWYQWLAERAADLWMSDRQAGWKDRLTCEHPNLLAAIEYGMGEPGQAEEALRLAMTVPLSYWYDRGLFREVRGFLNRLLARTSEQSNLRARAMIFDAQVAITQGDIEMGLRQLDRGEDLARQVGANVERAYAAFVRGYLPLHRGELPAALQAFARMDNLLSVMPAPDTGLALELRLGRLVAWGMAASLSGDHARADACHDEILAMTEPLGAEHHRSWALAGRALSAWVQGKAPEARTSAIAGLRLMRASGWNDVYGVAQCIEMMAWVAADQQQHRHAATLLGGADALRRAIGVPITAFGHMVIHHDECQRRVRTALGDTAYAAVVTHGRSLSHDEAIAYALGAPTAPTPPPAGRPTPLTRRENEVAGLIAAGLSNREIASALVISPRTVESHVERILAKLGLTSRIQVAAWAAKRRHGDQPGQR